MSDYTPTTTLEALRKVGRIDVSGYKLEDNREEVLQIVNGAINFLSNQYHRERLFDNYETCHDIEYYPVDCNDPCDCSDDYYWGITLDPSIAGINDAFYNNDPLAPHSRWYEGKENIISKGYRDIFSKGNKGRGTITPVAGTFALRYPLKKCSKLTIISESRFDEGKTFYISSSSMGDEYHIEDKLKGAGSVETCQAVTAVHNIQWPSDLVGSVRIEDEDGNLLVRSAPSDHIPQYRRYKVDVEECGKCYPNVDPKGKIAIRGTRKFKEVYFDTDIVPIGDERILRHAAVMLRYEHSLNPQERAVSDRARAMLMDELKGLLTRYKGDENEDGFRRVRRTHFYKRRIARRRR